MGWTWTIPTTDESIKYCLNLSVLIYLYIEWKNQNALQITWKQFQIKCLYIYIHSFSWFIHFGMSQSVCSFALWFFQSIFDCMFSSTLDSAIDDGDPCLEYRWMSGCCNRRFSNYEIFDLYAMHVSENWRARLRGCCYLVGKWQLLICLIHSHFPTE